MKVYKLTDQKHQTYNNTQWGPGVTHETNGEGGLCGPGWLHYYSSPELAVLLNPIHADFESTVLWLAKAAGKHKTGRGLKGGSTKLTTVKILPLPVVTTEQRIKFAIYCALEVVKDKKFVVWAKAWLDGTDRTQESARAAAWAAAWAVETAAETARAAAWAAETAAETARTAQAATWAARTAQAVAEKQTFSFLQRCAKKALKP